VIVGMVGRTVECGYPGSVGSVDGEYIADEGEP